MSEFFDHRDALRRTVVPGQRWVRHTFSFGANLTGATAVGQLTREGFQYAQTDSTDEEHWHVIAWGWTDTEGALATSVEAAMNSLALRNGGEYQGWTVVRNNDGSLPTANEPLF
jgi:hypothetical protein